MSVPRAYQSGKWSPAASRIRRRIPMFSCTSPGISSSSMRRAALSAAPSSNAASSGWPSSPSAPRLRSKPTASDSGGRSGGGFRGRRVRDEVQARSHRDRRRRLHRRPREPCSVLRRRSATTRRAPVTVLARRGRYRAARDSNPPRNPRSPMFVAPRLTVAHASASSSPVSRSTGIASRQCDRASCSARRPNETYPAPMARRAARWADAGSRVPRAALDIREHERRGSCRETHGGTVSTQVEEGRGARVTNRGGNNCQVG